MTQPRPCTTALLFLLCMLMLAVPVVPHHHHGTEAICLRNDLHTHCAETTQHPGPHSHCCHDKGCVSTHFFQQAARKDSKSSLPRPSRMPDVLAAAICLLLSPECQEPVPACPPYLESLHGTYITRAFGLRAPPAPCA